MRFFKRKKETNINSQNSRYDGKPILIMFENFVLDTIGKLPKDKIEVLNSMNLAKVFNTEHKDWKLIIKEVLNLSETIEIAILDLWYKNQEISINNDIDYDPQQFAMDFVDNFYKENSKIDVWENDSLNIAKEKIKK